MSDEAQAQAWKDPESRDEPAADHPAGQIRLSQMTNIGVRAAMLMGVIAVGAASAAHLNETFITTISIV